MLGFKHIFFPLVGISLLMFLTLGILNWMQVSHGSFIDWLCGLGAFWWLVVVITVPWNIYFESRQLLVELAISQHKNINTQPSDEAYLKRSAKIYLGVALVAHVLSAVILAALSYFEVSAIGYVGAIVALLLTFLRPILRLHQYIVARLRAIRQEIHYPRQDLHKVLDDLHKHDQLFTHLQTEVTNLQIQLNTDEIGSFAQSLDRRIADNERQLQALSVQLKNWETQNKTEHDQLKKHAENAIAQLSEDANFLSQAREIIRFIKNA